MYADTTTTTDNWTELALSNLNREKEDKLVSEQTKQVMHTGSAYNKETGKTSMTGYIQGDSDKWRGEKTGGEGDKPT